MQSALDVGQDGEEDVVAAGAGVCAPERQQKRRWSPCAVHSLCEVWRGIRRNGDGDGDGGRGVHCDG